MPLSNHVPLLPDILIAFCGVTVLFYALRGLAQLPILARLALGGMVGIAVLGAFGAVILAVGTANLPPARLAFDAGGGGRPAAPRPAEPRPAAPAAVPRAPAHQPAVAMPPAPASLPAGHEVVAAPAPVPPAATSAREVGGPEMPAVDCTDITVLFGTDRAREVAVTPVRYGSERAHRLELGRAVVRMPCAGRRGGEAPLEIIATDVLSEASLLEDARRRLAASQAFKDHALLLVHGYNTPFEQAVHRAAQIAHDVGFDGAPFVYSWPATGRMASYTYDRDSARQAVPYLRAYLELVLRKSGARKVSIVAHGLGSEPLLAVLQALGQAPEAADPVAQVILVAPDLDRAALEQMVRLGAPAASLTLYSSATDRAIVVARRFYGGVPRAGDVAADGPVVAAGVETIDLTDAGAGVLGLDEPDRKGKTAFVADLGRLLQSRERPPELRRVKAPGGGEYWRFMAAH